MTTTASPDRPQIKVLEVQALTPDTQAVLELGKRLFSDALESGRDTCKFLVTISASAVPVYVALLRLVVSDRFVPSRAEAGIILVPGVFFLAAIVVAADALRPSRSAIRLNVVEDIVGYRDQVLKRRARAASISFWCFSGGILLALLSTVTVLFDVLPA
jgi:hypothetical protein